MVPDPQESLQLNRKKRERSLWLGRQTKAALCAETRGASSNQRQLQKPGHRCKFKPLKWLQLHDSLPFFCPRSLLKWEYISSPMNSVKLSALENEEFCSGGDSENYFNPQRCLRLIWTLIQAEIPSPRRSFEQYHLCICRVRKLFSTLIFTVASAAA